MYEETVEEVQYRVGVAIPDFSKPRDREGFPKYDYWTVESTPMSYTDLDSLIDYLYEVCPHIFRHAQRIDIKGRNIDQALTNLIDQGLITDYSISCQD